MQYGKGFLKRSQEFREDMNNGEYFPLLDVLYRVSAKHHDNLPTLFALSNMFEYSAEDVEHTLSILYPERKYVCNRVNISTIYCVIS